MELNYLSDLQTNMLLRVNYDAYELKLGDIIQITYFNDIYDGDGEIEIHWKWLYSEDKEYVGANNYNYFCDNNNESPTRELLCNLFEVIG